jgi:hypothetical protein
MAVILPAFEVGYAVLALLEEVGNLSADVFGKAVAGQRARPVNPVVALHRIQELGVVGSEPGSDGQLFVEFVPPGQVIGEVFVGAAPAETRLLELLCGNGNRVRFAERDGRGGIDIEVRVNPISERIRRTVVVGPELRSGRNGQLQPGGCLALQPK